MNRNVLQIPFKKAGFDLENIWSAGFGLLKFKSACFGSGTKEYLDLGLDLQVLKCLDLGLNQVLKMIKSQVLFSKKN